MVFLQAVANPKAAAAACFDLLEAANFDLYVSPEILAEVEEVLSRTKVRLKFPKITDGVVASLLKRTLKSATITNIVPAQFHLPRDPKDEPYVNLALTVSANFLVTRDNDLLSLMHNDEFRAQFPNLEIVDIVTFLRSIRAQIKTTN